MKDKMLDLKEALSVDDIIGKKIKDAKMFFYSGNKFMIQTEDNYVMVIEAEVYPDEDSVEIRQDLFDIYHAYYMGFVDDEHFEKAMDEKREKEKEQSEEKELFELHKLLIKHGVKLPEGYSYKPPKNKNLICK